MQNIFDEEIVHEVKHEKKQVVVDPVNAFLDVASHMYLSKNSLSICSYIAKNEGKLQATNIKSFLVMPYAGNEENGVYEYPLSKAFKKLDGFNTNQNTLEKFPQTEIDISGEWADINSIQVQLMLDAFKFVSDDVTRYFMNGIYFDEGNIVATDERRLFYSQGFDKFPAVILPNSKMLEWLLKKGSNIKHKIDKVFSVFQFEYKGAVLFYATTNIEGQFPNWRKVVPEKQTYTIGIPDLIAWKDIYSKIMQLKNKDTGERMMIKHDKDDMVMIEWENKIMGNMQWKGFYDENREYKEAILVINYKYLNDALTLKELKGIQFTEFIKAITFIYKDGSNHIVMPMQLD
jgi:DNA polymerase III sliding clamp (beta) subunit (PCNA family)